MSDATLTLEQSEDTPRSAFGVLQRRATVGTVVVLLGLAGVAWWSTVGNARDMNAMVQGLAHAGRAMPFDMAAPVFLGMWLTMMVAMMFPTVAPIVLLHRMVLRRRGEPPWGSIAFGSGYLLVWTAAGVVPLIALIGFREVSHGTVWVDRVGGAVLVLAGVYQFTRWKDACLKACRTPLSFLMTHDFGGGARGALRVGISHGLYCFGCCWALMAVLFVVGLMNLVWMAAIAAVFLAEKNWARGVGLTKVIGVAVTVFGVVVLVFPSVLGSLAPAVSDPGMTMSDPGMGSMSG